jgi:hypothetical protein
MPSNMPLQNNVIHIHFKYKVCYLSDSASLDDSPIYDGKLLFLSTDVSFIFEEFISEHVKEVYRLQYEKQEIDNAIDSVSIISYLFYKLLLVNNENFSVIIDLTRNKCQNLHYILNGKDGIMDKVKINYSPKYNNQQPHVSQPELGKLKKISKDAELRETYKRKLIEYHRKSNGNPLLKKFLL